MTEQLDEELPIIEDFDNVNSDEEIMGPKKIIASPADSEVSGLYDKYKKGRLLIQPIYQRNYVWDLKKASLLIESILMNIPIPLIYFAITPDNKINVIDGQQRLTSIFSYIDGSFPSREEFKLSGLKVLTDLKGKKFSELDEAYQNKILDYTVRTITFDRDSNPELQYEIFSRINTGAVALNTQELRNCIFRGPFNEFIKGLARDPQFLKILGYKAPHKRMQDVEFVLRFISFYLYGYQNYKPPIKTFLNETMRKQRNADPQDLENISGAFKNAVTNLNSLLGADCFKRFKIGEGGNKDGGWEKNRLNVALYDILMDSMSRLEPSVLYRHLDALREAYISLMCENNEFIDSITINTSDKPVVQKRFSIWNKVLSSVINDDNLETRCFSRELKEKLYKQNPTCEICKQHISSIDDSALDHIQQYWLGGRTIPENARLVHRYCNSARKRKEETTEK